ncbi:MAG: hypothetical protein ACRCVU_08295 [Flavobacterium sp.]
MKLFYPLLLFFCIHSFAQELTDINLAYKKRTLEEINIVRINYNANNQESYQFLIDDKYLNKDILTFYNPISATSLLEKPFLNILKHNDKYYFIVKTKESTIVSLAHIITTPKVEAKFLMLGSNHCLIPITSDLCYPADDGLSCLDKQSQCTKFNTKK